MNIKTRLTVDSQINITYKLVYFDYSGDVNAAIAHEKRVKKWRRQWKLDLITKFNPTWEDLYNKISG